MSKFNIHKNIDKLKKLQICSYHFIMLKIKIFQSLCLQNKELLLDCNPTQRGTAQHLKSLRMGRVYQDNEKIYNNARSKNLSLWGSELTKT